MVLIAESKGRADANSGYARLFGNQAVGQLFSRVQSAVIRTGVALQLLLERETPANLKTTLQLVFADNSRLTGTQVVFSPQIPATITEKAKTGDIIIFDHDHPMARVIELKDGDTFDTKKADGELASLRRIVEWITEQTGYHTQYQFCSFNQDDKLAIVKGAKSRFGLEHAMTGRELCAVLQLDYDRVRVLRQRQAPDNLRYFVSQLLTIPEVRTLVVEELRR